MPPAGRVLLVKPSSLGDVVHALPVAAALAAHPAFGPVDWVVNPEFAGLLQDNPAVRRVIRFPRRDWMRLPAFARELRRDRYDLLIDLQGLLRSGIISRVARAGRRVGMSDAREGAARWMDDVAPVPAAHAVERYRAVLRHLDLEPGPARFPLPPPGANPVPDPDEPYVVIHPHARWETKRLPEALVRRLVGALQPMRVVLVGRGPRIDAGAALDLTGGTDLRALLAVLAGARGVISTDSGPMHLACALGVPLVALFGPTRPEWTGPWTVNSRVVRLDLPCVPCGSRECANRERHACLEQIEPRRVVDALDECLAAPRPGE
jgi:ADP-heptose:LPS heptosyltransferase